MEKRRNIQSWLDVAVAGIRFKPDRQAVEAELRGHFEDKVADLQRMYHLDRQEAQEMALKQMGDAEEIGKEMAKIHRPWLGYLWQLSRALVILALVGIVMIWFWRGEDAFLGDWPASELWDFDGYPGNQNCDYAVLYGVRPRSAKEHYTPGDDPNQLMAKQCGEDVWINGQHIALRHAAIWKDSGQENLYLSLRLDTLLFWERGVLERQWFTLTDSLGNSYEGENINRLGGGYGPFHQCEEIVVRGIDPAAEWVCLDYGPGEAIFSMAVELEREVFP